MEGELALLKRNIFINCPFDEEYKPLFRPLVFTCIYCNLKPLVAQLNDSGKNRLERIIELMQIADFSIHDISRMESTSIGELARFNMPFELGIEFGLRQCESNHLKHRSSLVIDVDPYRYKKALSDLAGCDIASYGKETEGQVENLIKELRNWFTRCLTPPQPQKAKIWGDFCEFMSDLEDKLVIEDGIKISISELTESEFIYYAEIWITNRPKK
jgi:hypothetical protein